MENDRIKSICINQERANTLSLRNSNAMICMNIFTIKVRNTGRELIIFYIYQYENRNIKYLISIIEMKVDVL
jgi:hypothetical protein